MASLSLEEQRKAARLYESGLSAQQVADYFNVSLNASFYALRRQKVPRRDKAESNRIRFESKSLSYSIKENLTREEEDLKLAAIMLYWAEGYKAGKHSIDFANSDPNMALIFKRFLSEICRVDAGRIRCSLYCYEGQDIETLHEFWSNLLGIPREQFIKPYIKAAEYGPRGPRMLYGLVHLRYSDKKLLRQMLVWIDEYQLKCVGTQAATRTGCKPVD